MKNIRLSIVAMVLGIGLMLIGAFTGNESVHFVLPDDAAALASYNTKQHWRTVVSVIGAIVAVAAFVKWMLGNKHRSLKQQLEGMALNEAVLKLSPEEQYELKNALKSYIKFELGIMQRMKNFPVMNTPGGVIERGERSIYVLTDIVRKLP